MRAVTTRLPSFPLVKTDQPLTMKEGQRWQVLCGDQDHWRAGLYAPSESSLEEIGEFERHSCPELFLLLRGELTLVLHDPAAPGGQRELPLELDKPMLVTSPHAGYCPGGPHTGAALVVERDVFETEYRTLAEWQAQPSGK